MDFLQKEEDRQKAYACVVSFKKVLMIDPYTVSHTAGGYPEDVTIEEYFEKLYVDRSIRKRLLEALAKDPHDFFCVVGPRGSGKSTMLRKIHRDLREKGQFFSAFFDLRHQNVRTALKSEDEAIDFFRHWMKNEYLEAFSKADKWYELFAFLLDKELPEKYRPGKVSGTFIEDALLVSRSWKKKRKKMKKKLEKYKESNAHDQEEIRNKEKKLDKFDLLRYLKKGGKRVDAVIEQLLKKLDPAHLAYAYRYVFGEAEEKQIRQYFWFDNMDNLTGDYQVLLVNALHNLQQEIHENVQVVVAAREESVFRQEHHFDAGAPTHRRLVFLDDPHNLGAEPRAIETDTERVQSDVSKIITQRLQFFQTFLERRGEGCVPEVVELIQKLLEKVVCPVFKAEKVLYVANNSLRELLPMYADFLLFLLKKYDDYPREQDEQPFRSFPPALTDETYFHITELLYWLSYEKDYFEFYNIAEFCDNPAAVGGVPCTCFLPHVVLTCIWNLQDNKRIGAHPGSIHSPKIGEVLDKLKEIDFSEKDCLRVLYKLYRPQEGRSHFIVIETRKNLQGAEDIDPNYRVRITSRGKVALSRIFNTFGYFYGNIKALRGECPYTRPSLKVNDGKIVTDYLKKMYHLHLDALLSIRSTLKDCGENWLDYYLRHFGIPIERNLARKKELTSKHKIGGRTYILSYPYLIESMLPYFQSTSIDANLVKLLTSFNAYVEKLRKGEEQIFSFDLPVGLEEIGA